MIGTHSIKLVYALRDYSVITRTEFFTITFLDPCELPGHAFIDTLAQSQQATFLYLGTDEIFDVSVLFG